MHRLEKNILHHANKRREQRKYLVWIGGTHNAFNTLDEATTEKQNYLNKGYTDIQIETIN
jgi:hypothetical protein